MRKWRKNESSRLAHRREVYSPPWIQAKPQLVWLTGCRHVKDVTNFPITMFGSSAASQCTPPWQNSRAFPPSLSIYSTWQSGGHHHFFLPNYKHKIILDSYPALLGHDNIDLMTRRALSYQLIQFPHLQVGNYLIPFWHTKAEWKGGTWGVLFKSLCHQGKKGDPEAGAILSLLYHATS